MSLVLATDPLNPPDWAEVLASQTRIYAVQEAAKRELASRHLLHFTQYFTRDYLAGWVHEEVAELLMAFIEAVELKRSPRLIIQLPPRTGKSELVSRSLPPFILGKHPEWEVVTATYNQDLANDFGRDVRSRLRHPVFQDMFPNTQIRADSNAIDDVRTEQNGSYRAVGVGGALTGRGAHVMLIDDPVKNREDADSELVRETTWKWWQSVARTRLAPGGGVIVCLTRWHEDDLAGKMIQQQAANPDGSKWMLYTYPAIATKDETHRKTGEALHPERYSLQELNALRADMDPREWSALYQQNPTPPEGIAFKREWVKYAHPPKNVNWYMATDFAIGERTTNDRTVIWPFAVDERNDIYFGLPVRDRMPAERIVEAMCDLMERFKPVQLVMENVHISKTIGPYLKRRMAERRIYTPFWDFTASKDKLARASSLQGRMQQGRVYFHPDCKHIIEEEFIPFPAGRHDDAVDAASCGMLLLDRLMSAHAPPAPEAPPAPAWSAEWIKQRIAESSRDDKRHIPKRFNGHARKTKTR